MERRCSTCQRMKMRTDFSSNRGRKDGLNSVCKACDAEDKRRWRRRNRDKMRQYEACRKECPKKQARMQLYNAVRRGEVVKPALCQSCKMPTERRKLHGHHPDYRKPLNVHWVCSTCHGKEHRK